MKRFPKIKVLFCTAFNPEFKNIIKNSIHQTIAPPIKKRHLKDGVWVMGINEPVRLLLGEYEIIK